MGVKLTAKTCRNDPEDGCLWWDCMCKCEMNQMEERMLRSERLNWQRFRRQNKWKQKENRLVNHLTRKTLTNCETSFSISDHVILKVNKSVGTNVSCFFGWSFSLVVVFAYYSSCSVLTYVSQKLFQLPQLVSAGKICVYIREHAHTHTHTYCTKPV